MRLHHGYSVRRRVQSSRLVRGVVIALIVLNVRAVPLLAGKGLASYAEGKQFFTAVKDEDLQATPKWEATDDNPPLSAHRAINLATAMKNLLVKDSENHKWEFEAADLHFDKYVDRWYWEVTFWALSKRGQLPQHWAELQLVVLMDGKVIRPDVKPYPLPKPHRQPPTR
jgi:hypothetical protein